MIDHIRRKQGYNLERMKDFKIKIYQLDEILFTKTFLVDRDNLFQIDPEFEEHTRMLKKGLPMVGDEKGKKKAKRGSLKS